MTSRDQFQAWHQAQIATLVRCGAIDRAREFEAMKPTLELAWDESRAVVVVDLSDLSRCFSPDDCGDWAMWLSDVKETVEAAGLKVAS